MNELIVAKQKGFYGSEVWNEAADIYLRMLAPVAPHISEEMWIALGKPYSIHSQDWPKVDEKAAADESITLVIQINGKLRDRIIVSVSIPEEEAKRLAVESEPVQKLLAGKQPRQVIYVKGRLVNIVP